ncbi:SCO3242 family prenyltransferase [Streptomyces milbemycinicus]|uniref:SCO3242 family prenyltransferase n=1 Tax=Streptomyces milbemycinicus TaxID=476552 RepID=UPI003408878F
MSRLHAWAELLRLPALFTVPGDGLAGAAAVAARPDRRTALAVGCSLCLYEAGMALNDWADRAEDAVERPHRPLPSGRIRPAAALAAACALTAAGLALAARAGRPALAVAVPLAATVWSYDLVLKRTPAGPGAMAAARGLDLLLGAAATAGTVRPALPSAALLSTHTLAVTAVSRQETRDGTPLAPLAALAATATLTRLLPGDLGRERRVGLVAASPSSRLRSSRGYPTRGPSGAVRATSRSYRREVPPDAAPWPAPSRTPGHNGPAASLQHFLTAALALSYAAATARPYLNAALNPSPPLTQRAVGAGIRATIPLQAALAARAGAGATALGTAALTALARRFSRRVSVT